MTNEQAEHIVKQGQERVASLTERFHDNQTLPPEEVAYLLVVAKRYWILSRIADGDWEKHAVEKFNLQMEIEDLKGQLSNALDRLNELGDLG